jgi:pyruvate-formate lyase-activating enzyme
MSPRRGRPAPGLAYCDARAQIYFDETQEPLADDGCGPRSVSPSELIAAPKGTVTSMLPQRNPLLAGGRVGSRRIALAALLPAGYTRLLLPAYRTREGAPMLPLYGYTFACVVDDKLRVAAMRTDASDDWTPRYFAEGELEAAIAARLECDPENRVLAQAALCSREYGCFTAQNTILSRGEAALPVSPKCNARCIGCISELAPGTGFPSPQTRISREADVDELVRVGVYHLERVPDGIVSFGQGCEGEPLLRAATIAQTIERIRAERKNGTVNCNTNGSRPKALQSLIDAGLDAVRISLNSFRPAVYAAYYRPLGYSLDDVLESVRLAVRSGLRVSLNLLTHPGVTDAPEEVAAADAFVREVAVTMVQTRTLNIDPEVYFAAVGRPAETIGMRAALAAIAASGARLGNFTHAH